MTGTISDVTDRKDSMSHDRAYAVEPHWTPGGPGTGRVDREERMFDSRLLVGQGEFFGHSDTAF